MMGVVYRQTNTSADIFKPEPKTVMKIFTIVYCSALVITFGLSWYTGRQLNATNVPADNAVKFQNVKSIMVFVMNVSFFALVLLSNAYSLALKKLAPVPYLLTIAFFGIFVIKDSYYLTDYYMLWQRSLQLFKGDLPDFHSNGWIKCWLGAAVTAFNAIMVWWGMRK
jgi:hypothetical protein